MKSDKAIASKGNVIDTAKRGFSSLQDALTDRTHSKDFIYARSDFLRSRVLVIGSVFLVLLPFWTILDWLMLPESSLKYTLPSRLIMLIVLTTVVLLAFYSKTHLHRSRLSAGLLLATPGLFYALVLTSLAHTNQLPIGYSFIPYMLIAVLAIFPFTLIESLIMGLAFIVLHIYALHVANSLYTLSGLQDIWLLLALLSMAITANYFQLGLMLRLYREATHDPLTGLLNRGALMRSMQQLTMQESSSESAILMMDLDNFKRINDNHSHLFGDDVLRSFTKVLRNTLRQTDIVARYGGEEFIAILVNTTQEEAVGIAEKVRANAESENMRNYDGEPVKYTVSIGVAMIEPDSNFETAIKQADNRLYEAKKLSRNCVVGV